MKCHTPPLKQGINHKAGSVQMATKKTLTFVSTPHPDLCEPGYLERAFHLSTERSGAVFSGLKIFKAPFFLFEGDEKIISLQECLEVIRQTQENLSSETSDEDTFWPNRVIIPRTDLCDLYLDHGFTRYTLSNIAVAQAAGIPVRANFMFDPDPEVEKIVTALGIHHTIFHNVKEDEEGVENFEEEEEEEMKVSPLVFAFAEQYA